MVAEKKACTLKKNVAFAQKNYSDDWVIWSMASGREIEGPDTELLPRAVWPDAGVTTRYMPWRRACDPSPARGCTATGRRHLSW